MQINDVGIFCEANFCGYSVYRFCMTEYYQQKSIHHLQIESGRPQIQQTPVIRTPGDFPLRFFIPVNHRTHLSLLLLIHEVSVLEQIHGCSLQFARWHIR